MHHPNVRLALLTLFASVTLVPRWAFAGCEAQEKAIETCKDTVAHAKWRCDDGCEATHGACWRANRDRSNAQAACDDRFEACKERCDARFEAAIDCAGPTKALEKCEEREAEKERIAAEKEKLAGCRKRWGAKVTIAGCDEQDAAKAKAEAEKARAEAAEAAEKARVQAEKAQFEECRQRWGEPVTLTECANKDAERARCTHRWGSEVTIDVCRARENARRSRQQVAAAKGLGKGQFRDNGDGTVTQTDAGLVWQKADSNRDMDREEAFGWCAKLGLVGGGWRLPGIEELVRLIDTSRRPGPYSPADSVKCDAAFATCGYRLWSASPVESPVVPRDPRGWYVNFQEGGAFEDDYYNQAYMRRVRCVRQGPPTATFQPRAP